MERMTFRMTANQKHILDKIAETEKLKNYTEVFRFLIEGHNKKSNEPKVSEQKPATIQMADDPEVKRDINKILKISIILGQSLDARAIGEVAMILKGEDEPL